MKKTLIIIEHDGHNLKRSSLSAITLARQLGGEYALAILGADVSGIVESVRSYGATEVYVADDALLAVPQADRHAAVIAYLAEEFRADTVLGVSSTITKDILPRTAALLDAPMLTDVTAVIIKDGNVLYQRPVNSGSLCATVKVEGDVRVLTARGTAFAPPLSEEGTSPIRPIPVVAVSLPTGSQILSRERSDSDRPDLSEARIVVSGGRPLQDKETFEQLIGGLADVLGGAVGATRAAVDAGMVPNDFQVGQTGKTVAPDLYIAVGVSGAIQHLTGIKDSKVIVAINRDPDAPVFQIANYGLVGDLHEIVPSFIEAIRKA